VSHKVAQPGSDIGPGDLSPSTSGDAIAKHYDFPPAASCDKLVQSLKARKPSSSSCQVSGKTEGDYPLLILTFDEAHTLTNREETAWSNFSVLGYVFRPLYHFPLFALFLSTTGRISQFTSPDEDASTRIILCDLKLIEPFIDLGFDTLANKVALDGTFDLERVTHDTHIVHMGRPL
jgi:hypothetical protein